MKNMDNKRMTEEQKKRRAMSHYDQWQKLSKCYEKFKETKFDFYIKLRDDSVFLQNMDAQLVHCESFFCFPKPCFSTTKNCFLQKNIFGREK